MNGKEILEAEIASAQIQMNRAAQEMREAEMIGDVEAQLTASRDYRNAKADLTSCLTEAQDIARQQQARVAAQPTPEERAARPLHKMDATDYWSMCKGTGVNPKVFEDLATLATQGDADGYESYMRALQDIADKR